MRAKINFLAESPEDREKLRFAQQALTALAVAFSHSFTMREFQPESDFSDVAWAELFNQADGVLAGGSPEFLALTARKLNCFAMASLEPHPEAADELSRMKTGTPDAVPVIWPLSTSGGAAGKTAVAACALAKKLGKPLIYIEDADTGNWQALLSQTSKYAALALPQGNSLDGFLDRLLIDGQLAPVIMAGPANASLVLRLTRYLAGTELLGFEVGLVDQGRVHLVSGRGGKGAIPLYALLYATSCLVRGSLKLEREADCLEAAVNNVLASGALTAEFGLRKETVSADELLQRVCSQIEMAGELIERFS